MVDKHGKKSKKETELEQKLGELTADLQRVQADFVNYRRRVDDERKVLMDTARAATIMKLLPVIDTIERAVNHLPTELEHNNWAQGVVSLAKSLDKSLQDLSITRITATPGTVFDPNEHEAVMMEDGEGDVEVIAEELRAGYRLGNTVIRHSMVRVSKQAANKNG